MSMINEFNTACMQRNIDLYSLSLLLLDYELHAAFKSAKLILR